jgi:hypothetical protein
VSNIVPIEIENIDPGFPPDWLVSGDQVTAPALDEKKSTIFINPYACFRRATGPDQSKPVSARVTCQVFFDDQPYIPTVVDVHLAANKLTATTAFGLTDVRELKNLKESVTARIVFSVAGALIGDYRYSVKFSNEHL